MTTTQAETHPASQGPLAGLKVIDFSRFAAGPYAARLLGDFGADVIKVERPGEGDEARWRSSVDPAESDPLERSPLYLYANTNKRGITLDPSRGGGGALFRKLVAAADILIEDRTPGEMDGWGLGFEQLHALNPRLIVVSVTPFGQEGPYAGYKAQHLNLFHASGQGYLLPTNSPDLERPPLKGAGFLGEFDAGLSAAIATLGALYWRDAGGEGQHVDVSKQHAVMHLEKSELRRYVDEGVSSDRTHRGRLLETLVRGRDGEYVVLILSSQVQWDGLSEAMGRPGWASEPPFDTQAGRAAHHGELKARLQDWAQAFTAEEIFHKVQGARSACAPIYSAAAFAASPQIAHRDYLVEINHPVAGRLRHPGRPWRFSVDRWEGRAPAPRLGEHTREVLGGELGCSEAELARLHAEGIV